MRRTRPRSSRMLMVLSVVLGVLTTMALRGHLARLEAAAAAAGPGEPTVVAAAGLDRGTVLGPGMLESQRIPARYRPPGALSRPAEALGRTLAADVAAGEAITTSRLAPSGGPVASLVPPGLRAVPVASAIPEGTVVPGDRVDVLATFATGQAHTETVVSGAEVLMVLPGSGGDELAPGTTVVLLVGPEVAEQLAFARTFADLALAIAPSEEGR
jgi:Flp pilus assembly protein CpaB